MDLSQKRLRFDSADLVEEGRQCRVKVTFSFVDQVIQTSAVGEKEGLGPLRAAAVAALAAVEQAVSGRFVCRLTDLDHVNALGKDLIAVLVDVEFEGREVQLFGSCSMQESDIGTAAKAALNATNRFFELAMRE